MSRADIKEELREIAIKSEMDYFGVASIDRLSNLPEGHRPQDLVPGAKSVISIGKKIPQGPLLANQHAFEKDRIQILSFTMYGMYKMGFMLNQTALRVVRRIEQKYHKVSMPIPCGEPHDEEKWMSVMSNRYIAAAAGIGELVWSGFVATPEAGPRIMWASVVTELELEADPLYNGPKLCDPKSCGKCMEVCPVRTLGSKEPVKVKMGDFETEYAGRSKPMCRLAVKGLVKGTPGRLKMDVPLESDVKTMEDWHKYTKKDDPWQRMEFNHGNYCLRCMTQCPIGQERQGE